MSTYLVQQAVEGADLWKVHHLGQGAEVAELAAEPLDSLPVYHATLAVQATAGRSTPVIVGKVRQILNATVASSGVCVRNCFSFNDELHSLA